ncbi:MAG: hypothetical protein KGJ57_22425 [Sphingomonadales bacterium]|nr:hypothetical protein [Sphingomonadales bacterium]MDE2172141.1 hypothetical protein [Sphingomonadales bacterium]
MPHRRLFIAEIANGTVDSLDLTNGQRQRIKGLAEPQGIAYLPSLDQLVVACGGDGTVRFYEARRLVPLGLIKLGEDADNVRITPGGQIAVGYGSGAIALIDAANRTIIRQIALPVHPEGFQIDDAAQRLYVNLPNARSIAVVDLVAGSIVARWRVPHRLNFPMAVVPQQGVIAIASRLPAYLTWFDATHGSILQDLPGCGDADDLFHDPKRQRWYMSCGSGKVTIFGKGGPTMTQIGSVSTASGARTSLFSPELDRLIVAAPAGWLSANAKVLIFKPNN